MHPGDGTQPLFLFQAQIRLHLYTRQRPPRQRLCSNGQYGSDSIRESLPHAFQNRILLHGYGFSLGDVGKSRHALSKNGTDASCAKKENSTKPVSEIS